MYGGLEVIACTQGAQWLNCAFVLQKKKIRKLQYPWTLRPFSKVVFSEELKNVSLLWLRLERQAGALVKVWWN